MKKINVLLKCAALFFVVFAVVCTRPDYMNQLDMGGKNFVPENPCIADKNGNGIADMYDPDGPAQCHPSSTIKLELLGDTIIIIPKNDPNGVVAGLKFMAHANDPLYGNLDSNIVITGDVFTSQCSTFVLTYTVRNVANNIVTKTRRVIVDCDGPEIALNGENPMTVMVGKTYTEPGATAIDKVSGPATVTITKSPGFTTVTEHEDSVVYTAVDGVGNKSYVKRIVNVTKSRDTIPPVITLLGAAEMSLQIGVGSFIDPGYTATDNNDGDLHDKVQVTGSVNVTKIGTYTIYYNVSDQSGNSAEVKTRLVHITQVDTGPDTQKPEVKLLGRPKDTVAVGSVWTEPGYIVADNRDTNGLGATVVVTGGPVTTTAETYFRLTYTVKDKAGNTSDAVLRIVVISKTAKTDNIPPKLKLEGKAKDTIGVGTKYVDPGATATDSVPGNPKLVILTNITKVVTNSSGATVQFALFYQSVDLYTITYSVKDEAGNAAPDVKRSVYVRDTSAIPPDSMFRKYGVPLTDSLAKIQHTYRDTPFVVDGPAALIPKMKSVKEFTIAWDLQNKQVSQFSLSLWSGTYMNFQPTGTYKLTQTFASKEPSFTISGSGISKLDGSYYINATATKCVWVRTDGSFAIIFK
jgi:hypothetical protein